MGFIKGWFPYIWKQNLIIVSLSNFNHYNTNIGEELYFCSEMSERVREMA